MCRQLTYKQFANSNQGSHSHYFLPVFELAEILRVRSLRFPLLLEKDVLAAYGKFGGLARYCLDSIHDASEQSVLEKKVASAELLKVVEAVGSPDAHESVSHKLLHIKVGADFQSTRLE